MTSASTPQKQSSLPCCTTGSSLWQWLLSAPLVLCMLALSACLGRVDEESATGGDDKSGIDATAQAITSQPHAQPAYMTRSKRYAVRIKDGDDGAWKPVDVIADINGYDYAHFSLEGGPCEIEVTVLGQSSIAAHALSPVKDNLASTVSGNRIVYSIPRDKYTVLWVRDINERLVVAADPVHRGPPATGAHVFNDPRVKNDRNNIGNTTLGFQAAIDAASAYAGSENGGRGIVYVPAGAYAVGNLTLKSDMELYLAEGSALFFASNVANDIWNYTYRTDWTTKGNGTRWITTAPFASRIKIWGRGAIDGNARAHGNFYNNLLVVNNASDVEIDGIVLKNGSKWGTMIGRSDRVRISNVKFFQPMHGVGEDDAIDIIESQDVTITHSIGISFDDPFSVKSYTGSENYIRFDGEHEANWNITVDDAIAWTGCHAFKIGQGIGQTTANVTFKNSVVLDAAHAISIHRKAYAGTIQNITWDNIDVQKVSAYNLGRSWLYVNSDAASPGNINDITIKNIRLRDMGNEASPIHGHSNAFGVRRIHMRNIYTGATGAGSYAQNAADLRLAKNAFVHDLQVSQNGVRMFWDRDAVKVDGAGDWSPTNFKGNCGPGEAVTGMSQAMNSTLQGPHALRCKAYGAPFHDAFVAAHTVSRSGDAYRSGKTHATYDWDPGFAKSECGNGEYVSGVSQERDGSNAHSLKHLRCAAAPIAGNQCNSKSVMTDDRGENSGDWDPGYWKAECSNDTIMVGVSVTGSGKPRRILCCRK
jgi:hypothetical protein